MVEEEEVSASLLPRDRFAHKGTFGHALLLAGSKGKMGAALLSAKACLRSGAGLLTAHIPYRGETIFQTAFPEAMLSFDQHPDYLTTAPDTNNYSAIGMGPGLGQHMESAAVIERVLGNFNKPVVIDADAINIIASNKDLLNKIPPRSILTPHPKEFDRLVGACATAYERLLRAQSFAVEHKLIVVLKGAYTATCTTSGNIYFKGVRIGAGIRSYTEAIREARLACKEKIEKDPAGKKGYEEELAAMLVENADEPYAGRIAKAVMRVYQRGGSVDTTKQLASIIEGALSFLPPAERKEAVKKSCQRTFQALRIDVNSEFEVLYTFLDKLPTVLNSGGRVAVLTFHSGEDRLGKKAFKQHLREGVYSEISEDVTRPSAEECYRNPRAKSTKLRWAVRA